MAAKDAYLHAWENFEKMIHNKENNILPNFSKGNQANFFIVNPLTFKEMQNGEVDKYYGAPELKFTDTDKNSVLAFLNTDTNRLPLLQYNNLKLDTWAPIRGALAVETDGNDDFAAFLGRNMRTLTYYYHAGGALPTVLQGQVSEQTLQNLKNNGFDQTQLGLALAKFKNAATSMQILHAIATRRR